jgi:DNA gyrase subunit A
MVREMLARAETDTPGGRNAYRPEGLLPEYGMQTTGLYRLSDSQAQEILQMRLQRLTGLEQDKIVNEYKVVMEEISDLLDLLAKPERVTSVIETELKEVQAEFGIAGGDSGRRSFIEMNATELFTEDLITPQDMVVTLSNTGYMKSQPLSEYRAQKRGGRGKQAAATKNEDWIETLFVANTHDIILCFSDRGRMYWLKVWEVPQGSRTSRGKPIVNMFPLIEGEKITVILPIKGYQDDQYVFMATSLGTVKKTRLSDFSNPRKAGIIAVDLNENDFLVGAAITDGKHDVMLFSDAGKAVRFDENDVRPMGRTARGVRGMNLGDGHQVIAMLVAPAEATDDVVGVGAGAGAGAEAEAIASETNESAVPNSVLTATENGFGKRTPIGEYTRHGRGTKGMIAIQTSDRNGKVVAAALVSPEDQIMLITTGGILVRTRVSEIREMGRATQGVTLINVDEGTRLSGLQRIAEGDSDDENDLDDVEEGEVSADPVIDAASNEAGDA